MVGREGGSVRESSKGEQRSYSPLNGHLRSIRFSKINIFKMVKITLKRKFDPATGEEFYVVAKKIKYVSV